MIDLNEVKQEALKEIINTNSFEQNEILWINSILYRLDGKNGLEQLVPLILACETYNNKKNSFTKLENYLNQLDLKHKLFSMQALYRKNKSVLIAVPQRKKHPKCNVPNLFGLPNPQGIKTEVDTCYGLGYCEARDYFVQKALQKNKDYTHIFFIDDDILIPIDALPTMLNTNESIVSANYMKKNGLNESVCTYLNEDKDFIFATKNVEFVKDQLRLIPITSFGLGCTLISIEVFKKISYPYFEFIYDFDENGNKQLILGEDSFFSTKAIQNGFSPKCILGINPIHIDFKTGNYYGPDWIVDSNSKKIKKEYAEKYTQLACNPKELFNYDVDKIFI